METLWGRVGAPTAYRVRPARLRTVLGRLYGPVATLLLLVLLTARASLVWTDFDPNLVAQNPRLTFQSTAVLTPSEATGDGLSAQERSLADAVPAQRPGVIPGRRQILYIGNSQTLAIMDRQSSDLTTPQWLQVLVYRENPGASPQVRLGSLPNLSMAEMFIKLVATDRQQPRQVDVLVGSVVLQDLRVLSVRDDVLALADADPALSTTAKEWLLANPDLPLAAAALSSVIGRSEAPSDTATSAATAGLGRAPVNSRTLETQLEAALAGLPLFKDRAVFQKNIRWDFDQFYQSVLGINTATTRPIPEATYQANLQLLELTLRYGQSHHIPIALYLAPLRPIVPNPNRPEDVSRLRRDFAAECQAYGASCVDYTQLIPEELWTHYPEYDVHAGQLDFAHFTGTAHRLLAEHLIRDFAALLMN